MTKDTRKRSVMPVETREKRQRSEGNIECQLVTSELQREWNMEHDESTLRSFHPPPLQLPPPLPWSPVAGVLIRYASFVLHTGLAVGLDPHGYGNPDFCWLSVHDTLIWSFAGPIFVVVLVGAKHGSRVCHIFKCEVRQHGWNKRDPFYLSGEHCDLHPGRKGFLRPQAEGYGEVRSHVSFFLVFIVIL